MPRLLRRVLSLDDFEVEARRVLPRRIYSYVSGGCERNRSLQANLDAFGGYAWVTRILRKTSGPLLVPAECGADAGLLGAALAGQAEWG